MINHIKKYILSTKLFRWVYIKYPNRIRRIYRCNKLLFKNKSGVEIGGPSFCFSEKGPIPIYKIIDELDNINFSNETFWINYNEGQNFLFNNNKQKGKQIIADATDLSIVKDNYYDFMLSSHVIEHIANPIKALYEWKRIIKPNGYLCIIVPNMLYTYDNKRPLTKLDHIIDDYLNHVKENDETHFEEVIKMHDIASDSTVNNFEDHKKRTLDNINTRIVHHHTFQMPLLIGILKYCGFKIIDKQFFKPYHLMVIAQKYEHI